MAKDNPARHNPDLGTALTDQAAALHWVGGRTAETLEAIGEAVTIFRGLAKDNPGRHDPDLAKALMYQFVVLLDAKLEGDAVSRLRPELHR